MSARQKETSMLALNSGFQGKMIKVDFGFLEEGVS